MSVSSFFRAPTLLKAVLSRLIQRRILSSSIVFHCSYSKKMCLTISKLTYPPADNKDSISRKNLSVWKTCFSINTTLQHVGHRIIVSTNIEVIEWQNWWTIFCIVVSFSSRWSISACKRAYLTNDLMVYSSTIWKHPLNFIICSISALSVRTTT